MQVISLQFFKDLNADDADDRRWPRMVADITQVTADRAYKFLLLNPRLSAQIRFISVLIPKRPRTQMTRINADGRGYILLKVLQKDLVNRFHHYRCEVV